MKAFSWILSRAGMWANAEDERAAGRREVAIDILDAMGVTQYPNLVELTEGLLSTPLWDVREPTDT